MKKIYILFFLLIPSVCFSASESGIVESVIYKNYTLYFTVNSITYDCFYSDLKKVVENAYYSKEPLHFDYEVVNYRNVLVSAVITDSNYPVSGFQDIFTVFVGSLSGLAFIIGLTFKIT
jgi:hypothetical protein